MFLTDINYSINNTVAKIVNVSFDINDNVPLISNESTINDPTYDASTGNLVLTGTFDVTKLIDVTKLTITGQKGSTYTLTSATPNPYPSSSTSATVIVSGIDKVILYSILNQNGTNASDGTTYNIAAAANWQTGAAAIPVMAITVSKYFPLDFVSGATLAHGLTQLTVNYTGALINVRRSSDNATQDIYADSNGNLNVSSLSSFVGAGNGYVTTWYDQSGHGNNATQVTVANQPLIVSSGTVYTLNGVPTLYFDGSRYLVTPNVSLSQPNTIQFIGKYDSFTTGAYFTDSIPPASTRQIIGQTSTEWRLANTEASGTADTSSHIFTGVFNGVNSQLNVDNTTVINTDTTSKYFHSQYIGAGYYTELTVGMIGRITEYIVYPFVLNRISSAAYNESTGNLVLIGLDFNTLTIIDVTKLTIKGQGGSTYTLTSATANPTPSSSTSATVVIAGADMTSVNAILNKVGTAAQDSTIYNIAAAANWQTGAALVSTAGITVSGTTLVKTIDATYTINNTLVKTIDAVYSVNNALVKTIDATYTINNTLVKTIDAVYSVNNALVKTIDGRYTVNNTLVKTIDAVYSVNNALVKTIDGRYTVNNTLVKTIDAVYSVNNALVKTIDGRYTVNNTLVKTIDAVYSVTVASSNTILIMIDATYSINNLISRGCDFRYSINNLISQPNNAKYSVNNTITQEIDAIYLIYNVILKLLNVQYKISNQFEVDHTFKVVSHSDFRAMRNNIFNVRR